MSKIVSFAHRETLIHSGNSPDAIYVLLGGELEVGMCPSSSSGGFQSMSKHLPGAIVNRLSCFSGDVSICTVRNGNAGDSAVALYIPKDTMDRIFTDHPKALIECLDYILTDAISPVVHLLDWNLEWLHLQAGEVLAHRDEPCDSLFVVLNGRLRAARSGSGPIVPTNDDAEEFGRGACIGEIEVLTGEAWPADIYAVRSSELARMPVSVLMAIVHMFPRAGLHFSKVIASQVRSKYMRKHRHRVDPVSRKVRASGLERGACDRDSLYQSHLMAKRDNAYVESDLGPLKSYGLTLATVVVVPLDTFDDVETSVSEFCEMLTSALGRIAPVKLMTKTAARDYLGDRDLDHRSPMHEVKITRLLGDMEENYRLVVYQAETKYTWWTRLCVQHADCVLLLVRSDKVPEPNIVEQCLVWAYEALHVRIELVILKIPPNADGRRKGKHKSEGTGTFINISDDVNDWSEKRPWISHHHFVRVPLKEHVVDLHRMSRRITGRSVGLVLGGGGARGMAHLGVIKALQEAGIEVDIIGGTSQGAFVGALYAKVPDRFEDLMHLSRKMANAAGNMREKLLDLTLPLISYFSGKRFNKGIIDCLGETTRLQDLTVNFFCVSTDLLKAVQVVHTKGTCWKYVRASMSLHGYLPPIAENGSLLMDGGYMNVLPADVMKHRMGAKVVIAVDVSAETMQDYFEYGTDLSGWWLLWNSWNPFVKTVKVLSMGDLSNRLAWMSGEQRMAAIQDDIDLLLKPPVKNYGVLEYDKFDELVQIGYEYAKPRVDELIKKNPWIVG